jgi:nucleotide-binding universal stress UspA family protein
MLLQHQREGQPMAYKTILVHLTSRTNAGPLVECASAIGDRFGSHVIALHVFPAFRLTPPVPVPFSGELAGTLRRQIHDEAARIKVAADLQFAANMPRTTVPEWRSITTERRPAADVVVEHARSADLVVVGQVDPEGDFSDILDCPDQLVTGAGRPVLVLPRGTRMTALPSVVAVAWNGSREAARAVFDALPLLQLAQKVEIVAIEEKASRAEGHLPDTEIASSLARHGVKTRITSYKARDVQTADDLKERVQSFGSQLLVMGAYGHSRLTEFVFGGVTRRMLADMPFPIFFSN